MKLNLPKQKKLIELIGTFNLVGLIGFAIPATQHIFIVLVPWHLLLMGILLTLGHERMDRRFLLFFLIVYLATFFAEWVGVNTRLLFGNYYYGQTMGIKLWNIPVIMGVTWFLLIYSAGVTMQRSRIKNMWVRVITGAAILVLLDMLVEPVAMHFDYWHWFGGIVPLTNYLGWFAVSAVMLMAFEAFKFKRQGLAAAILLGMQFVFFGVLNLVLR